MKSITDQLMAAKAGLSADLACLMRKYSSLRDINQESRGVVFIGASFGWKELSLEARRLQSKLIQDFTHFISLVTVLLQDQPEATRKKIEQDERAVREIIEQNYLSWHSTLEEALNSALKALERMSDTIQYLYDSTEGDVLLIPDTNALLYNPTLEDWSFDKFSSFTIVLVPSVLAELDSHKVNHRNQQVREKSEGLIRRIKEYRRRGALSDGVPLRKGVSSIRALAGEPRAHEVLPWLDLSNPDDRFLSSFLEVVRHHPRSTAVAVTRDINLQNKAEFAWLPFLEPPMPGRKTAVT